MEKLIELLKMAGASDELAQKITVAMEEYKADVKKTLEEEYCQRAEKAKTICLEELEKEKSAIARKVEVYLEARMQNVIKEAQRQAANGDTEATRRLRELKALLEGVQISGTDDQAGEELKSLRVKVQKLSEELERKDLKANRANQIAMKVIQRNRILESQLQTKPATVVTESKVASVAKLGDLKKESAEPKTLRPVSTASIRKAPGVVSEEVDPGIAAIAAQVE